MSRATFFVVFFVFKPPSWEQKSMTPKHKSKPMVHRIDTSTKTSPLTPPCTLLYLGLCCTTGILVFSLIESEHLEHLVLWNEFYSSALLTQIGSKPVWDQRQLKHLASFSAKKSQWRVIISQLWTRQVKLWLNNATAYRCIQYFALARTHTHDTHTQAHVHTQSPLPGFMLSRPW